MEALCREMTLESNEVHPPLSPLAKEGNLDISELDMLHNSKTEYAYWVQSPWISSGSFPIMTKGVVPLDAGQFCSAPGSLRLILSSSKICCVSAITVGNWDLRVQYLSRPLRVSFADVLCGKLDFQRVTLRSA